MRWLNIRVACTKDRLDYLEEQLWDHGAVSVTFEDASGSPIYGQRAGEEATWKHVFVTGMFDADVIHSEITTGLVGKGFEVIDVDIIKDRVWEREWLDRF